MAVMPPPPPARADLTRAPPNVPPGPSRPADDPGRLQVLQVILHAVRREADALGERRPGQPGLGPQAIHDPVRADFRVVPDDFWVVFWVVALLFWVVLGGV